MITCKVMTTWGPSFVFVFFSLWNWQSLFTHQGNTKSNHSYLRETCDCEGAEVGVGLEGNWFSLLVSYYLVLLGKKVLRNHEALGLGWAARERIGRVDEFDQCQTFEIRETTLWGASRLFVL